MTTVPTSCQGLANSLAQKEKLLTEIRAEYNSATGQDKDRLFYLMRGALAAVSQAEAALNFCVNPPPALPDLSAKDFTIRWHTDKKAFDFAVLVHNDGAPVSGPFKITLGITYVSDYSQSPPLTDTAEITVTVPAGLTLQTGDTYTSEYFLNIPFVVAPGSSFASDTFYALVDSDDQIQESNKANNNLQQSLVLKPPLIVPLPVGPAKNVTQAARAGD